VQHACDDGLGSGYAEVDIVVAVYDNAEAGADVISRAAAVTKPGNLLQVTAEARKAARGGCDTADFSKRA
jgi:hypothetical protein